MRSVRQHAVTERGCIQNHHWCSPGLTSGQHYSDLINVCDGQRTAATTPHEDFSRTGGARRRTPHERLLPIDGRPVAAVASVGCRPPRGEGGGGRRVKEEAGRLMSPEWAWLSVVDELTNRCSDAVLCFELIVPGSSARNGRQWMPLTR